MANRTPHQKNWSGDITMSPILMGVLGALFMLSGLLAGGSYVFQQIVATQYLLGGALLLAVGVAIQKLVNISKTLLEFKHILAAGAQAQPPTQLQEPQLDPIPFPEFQRARP